MCGSLLSQWKEQDVRKPGKERRRDRQSIAWKEVVVWKGLLGREEYRVLRDEVEEVGKGLLIKVLSRTSWSLGFILMHYSNEAIRRLAFLKDHSLCYGKSLEWYPTLFSSC